MSRILDDYLEEIGHYLGMREGAGEILQEIRSHILDKAQAGAGSVADEALLQAIKHYGPAQNVAEKYLEESPIIHPSYRKFLFRYTWLLFAVHYGLKVVSFAFGTSFSLLPFDLSIKVTGWMELLTQIPVTWIYDFGLTALAFYFITQNPGDIRPVWPKLFKKSFKPVRLKQRKNGVAWFLLALFVVLTAVFLHRGTIFFLNPAQMIKPDPASSPEIYRVLSLLVLFILAVESATIFLRNRLQSLWVDFVNSLAYLIAFGLLLNVPKTTVFPDPRLEILAGPVTWIVGTVMVLLVWDLFRILRTLFRKRPES